MRASASWVSSMPTEYAASSASPTGTPTTATRGQRASARTSRAPAGTKTTAFSVRCPPPTIQNPSGAGPPMSHEQVVSRPSAGTMPGAPFAGMSVIDAITATDQTNPAIAPAVSQPRRGRSASASSQHTRAAPPMRRSITPTPPTGNTPPTLTHRSRPSEEGPGAAYRRSAAAREVC